MHFARGSNPRSGSGELATAMMSGLELSEGFTGNWNCRKRLQVQRAFIRTKLQIAWNKGKSQRETYRTKVL